MTVTPTPVATQDIDVTGTQNIDQANTCDDDDLGVPGEIECLNEASAIFFGNSFSLTHDQAADVSVESFEQDINQANTCFYLINVITLEGTYSEYLQKTMMVY